MKVVLFVTETDAEAWLVGLLVSSSVVVSAVEGAASLLLAWSLATV